MLIFSLVNLYVVGPLVVSGVTDELRDRRDRRRARLAGPPVVTTERPVKVAA
jgi:hypothetical protein